MHKQRRNIWIFKWLYLQRNWLKLKIIHSLIITLFGKKSQCVILVLKTHLCVKLYIHTCIMSNCFDWTNWNDCKVEKKSIQMWLYCSHAYKFSPFIHPKCVFCFAHDEVSSRSNGMDKKHKCASSSQVQALN